MAYPATYTMRAIKPSHCSSDCGNSVDSVADWLVDSLVVFSTILVVCELYMECVDTSTGETVEIMECIEILLVDELLTSPACCDGETLGDRDDEIVNEKF